MASNGRARKILPLILAVGLALAPCAGWAKVAKGQNLGSMGSGTFTHNPSAKPIDRTVTQPPKINAPPPPPSVTNEQLGPLGTPRAAAPFPQPGGTMGQPSYFQRHPFFSGLAGGFVGAGLGSMLFGGGHFFGEGGGGFLGFALQMLVLFFVVRWAIGFFRKGASKPSGYARPDITMAGNMIDAEPSFRMAPRQPLLPARTEITLGDADLAAFEQLLSAIQGSWSHGDIPGLRQLMTPEMSGYLAEQIAEDRTRGVENKVEQVHLLKGDVLQAWREGEQEYGQVRMQWSAVDYTVRLGNGALVEGNPHQPVETAEVWTFLRTATTGWVLTAIQQVN